MASLDLDEIDDFLSSLDPENYSLRHAFMPMDQEDEKNVITNANGTQSERRNKTDIEGAQSEKQTEVESTEKTSDVETRTEEVAEADRSPGSSSADEPSPPTGRPIREQDRFLPLAIVSRLMKECIPSTAKVSRGARHLLQECVSEFIAFVTSEAIDRCLADRRKTLTGEDLMAAMRTLGFDNYVSPMSLYLEKIQAQLRGDHLDTSPPADRPTVVKIEEEDDIKLVSFSQPLHHPLPPHSSRKYMSDSKRW